MAFIVPEKLKSADISRFVQRAAQVEPHKPAIAYWAYYWIVQQILTRGLHNADEACKQFTTSLVDKLEQMKYHHAGDDAIIDDVAGQAYVEQFGLEIFQRADNAVIANKATRTTGDNFWTAATFLDLLHIWGTPSPDIAQKIKYAKVEAARILKAVKAGEDPNLTNPIPAPQADPSMPILDPNDPEVKRIDAAAQQTSVEEVPEEHNEPRSALSPNSEEQSLDTLKPTTIPDISSNDTPVGNNMAGIEPPWGFQGQDTSSQEQTAANPRHNSVGGGYFPEHQNSRTSAPEISPDVHSTIPGNPIGIEKSSFPPPAPPPFQNNPNHSNDPNVYYTNSALPTISPPPASTPVPPQQPLLPPTLPASPPPPQQPPWPTFSQSPQQSNLPTSSHRPTVQQPLHNSYQQQETPQVPAQGYLTDDMAMSQATRHAKFAISALNFEDVPTAVKELREALKSLGAS